MNKHLKNQILSNYLTMKEDYILIRRHGQMGMGYIIFSFVIGAYILSSVFFPKSITFGPTGMEYLFGLIGLLIIIVPLFLKRGTSTLDLKQKTLIHPEGSYSFQELDLSLKGQRLSARSGEKEIILIEASKKFPVHLIGQEISLLTGIPFHFEQ